MSNFRLNTLDVEFPAARHRCGILRSDLYDVGNVARAVPGRSPHRGLRAHDRGSRRPSLRPVVEALGLEWHAEIIDHERTAKERGVITTASYAQVTEPLYRGAAGRWQRYRKHLEPVLPTLQPWIEKFGYEI